MRDKTAIARFYYRCKLVGAVENYYSGEWAREDIEEDILAHAHAVEVDPANYDDFLIEYI